MFVQIEKKTEIFKLPIKSPKRAQTIVKTGEVDWPMKRNRVGLRSKTVW